MTTLSTAEDRKARTIARLREEGVPVLESLPCIEDEGEAIIREPDEIADRAIALLLVAGKGTGVPAEALDDFAEKYNAAKKLSPAERSFMAESAPSEKSLSKFAWRYEALLVLLWALGFLDLPDRPSEETDVDTIGDVIFERAEAEFREQAQLRSDTELLDFADLMYRYHWALRRQDCDGLNRDVVMEWDHAVRWLVSYEDQDWDDVTCDT